MKKELNIVEILKNKPEGISLYSSVFGGCVYRGNCDNCIEVVTNNCYYFNEKGHYITNGVKSENGECLLFPSNEMRNWSKFAWKKGDVLVSNDSDSHIIFKGFSKDDYTIFEGKYWISVSKKRHISCLYTQNTQNYHIEDNKEVAQTYINTIEERLGCKLNLKTLEVENQHEFKDGDIVAVDLTGKIIRIFERKVNEYNYCWGKYYIGFNFNSEGKLIQTFKNYKADYTSDRLATEEEKQQLFEALAKEGKAWDAEKKQIIDLKPKIELKPFDRVLVRNRNTQRWDADLFGFKSIFYHCVGGSWNFCIPYIGNESLLGTTKDAEK